MTRRVPPGQLAVVGVVGLLVAALWTRVFDPRDVAPVAVAGVGLPLLTSAAVSWRRVRHAAFSSAAHLVAFAVVLVVATRTFAPTTWWDGITRGWSDLLSASLPAPPQPAIMVVPALVIAFTTAVAAELTIRTRGPLAPLAPLVGGAGAVYLFGENVPGRSLLEPAAFIGIGAVLVLLRAATTATTATSDASGVRRRGVLGALPVAAVISAVAVLLGSLLPFLSADRPLQLRDHWETRDRPDPMLNPLGRVTRAAADAESGAEARAAFSVVLDRDLDEPPRFRLVTLDVINQFEWSSEPRFVAVGRSVPDGDDPVSAGRPVTQRITLAADEAGVWLPALDRPRTVEAPLAAHVEVDAGTGQLIGSGRGLRYEVTSLVPTVDFKELAATASPAADPAAQDSLRLPDAVPAALQRIATELGEGTRSSWEQLARLIAFFDPSQKVEVGGAVVPFTQDPSTVLGHSLASLEQFVTTNPAGTSEQFATAFTVLARLMGFPARVVVGYVPRRAPSAGERIDVMTTDLQAWPEVRLTGHGWVTIPFGYSADAATAPDLPDEIDSVVTDTLDSPGGTTPPPDRVLPERPEPAVDEAMGWAGRIALVLGALGALAVLVTAPASIKRIRRRRRRRRGTAAERIGGAWLEAMDRLQESGVDRVSSLVPSEAARASAEEIGVTDSTSLIDLGTLVQRALHGRTPPSEADVDAAWAGLVEFEGRIGDVRSARDAVRAALDPRPLVPTGRDDEGR